MDRLKRYVPVTVSLILIVIIIRLAPWGQVVRSLDNLTAGALVGLFGLSLVYYGAKTIRFWLMLKRIDIKVGLKISALTYLSAQPVSLLPAGELYRMRMLERFTGVPMAKSSPTFVTQGVFEGIAMSLVGLFCALTAGHFIWRVLIFAGLMLAAVLALRMGLLEKSRKYINRIPFISVSRDRMKRFSERHKTMLEPKIFAILLAWSLLAELAGVFIVYISVNTLGGNISFFQAGLAYIGPVIVSFLSLLPGGFGASEQSSIGILALLHVQIALAVAATLVIRFFLVITGLLYGAAARGILQVQNRYRDRAKTAEAN